MKNQIIEPKITTYIGAAVGKPVSNTQQIGWKTTNVNNSYIFTPIPNEVINATITEKIAFKTLIDQKLINKMIIPIPIPTPITIITMATIIIPMIYHI